MTELQWLIKMLTQHKLSPALKDLFIERIGDVEKALSDGGVFTNRSAVFKPIAQSIQAPSMQKILDQMETAPVSAVAAHVPPRTIIPTEVVTSKGNGTSTRGPRKF